MRRIKSDPQARKSDGGTNENMEKKWQKGHQGVEEVGMF